MKFLQGVSVNGLTLPGFWFLHAVFIEKGSLDTVWAVLRRYGYNNDVLLDQEVLSEVNFTHSPEQVKTSPKLCISASMRLGEFLSNLPWSWLLARAIFSLVCGSFVCYHKHKLLRIIFVHWNGLQITLYENYKRKAWESWPSSNRYHTYQTFCTETASSIRTEGR